jgi:ATP-dependent helicase/nuclease subunit B
VYEKLAAVLGVPLEKHIERLERTRSELELVTGFHPVRMEEFASLLGDQRDPSTEETLDLLAGVSHLHRDLQRRLSSNSDSLPSQAVSKTSLLCRGLRILRANQSAWADVYPSIETLSVTGTSMLTAPIADLCRLVSQKTTVDVHVHLREASGPQIRRQLTAQCDIEQFGSQEVFEWR